MRKLSNVFFSKWPFISDACLLSFNVAINVRALL